MKENKNKTELTDEQLEQVSGGALSFEGTLNLGGGKTAKTLDEIPAGTVFWGYFDGTLCQMRRNNKDGFNGVTILGTNVFYSIDGENHSIVV